VCGRQQHTAVRSAAGGGPADQPDGAGSGSSGRMVWQAGWWCGRQGCRQCVVKKACGRQVCVAGMGRGAVWHAREWWGRRA